MEKFDKKLQLSKSDAELLRCILFERITYFDYAVSSNKIRKLKAQNEETAEKIQNSIDFDKKRSEIIKKLYEIFK